MISHLGPAAEAFSEEAKNIKPLSLTEDGSDKEV
jgi:hypothetical protein